jgi:hypothetical protein
MPTPAAERNGLAGAAKSVSEHASAIARLEVGLALVELKEKLLPLGRGAGLGIGAAIFVLFGLAGVVATAIAALTLVVPVWLSVLIVTGGIFMVAGALVFAALKDISRGTPPTPERAIEQAKLTAEAVKANGHH